MSFAPQWFQREVLTIPSGGSFLLPAQGLARFTVIAGAGCTATISRVDSSTASAHTTGAPNQFTVSAGAGVTTTVDWPYYYITAAGGSCRLGAI